MLTHYADWIDRVVAFDGYVSMPGLPPKSDKIRLDDETASI